MFSIKHLALSARSSLLNSAARGTVSSIGRPSHTGTPISSTLRCALSTKETDNSSSVIQSSSLSGDSRSSNPASAISSSDATPTKNPKWGRPIVAEPAEEILFFQKCASRPYPPRMEKPDSVLETLVEGDFTIEAGITGMQGFRGEMEDRHIHAKMPDAPDHLFLGVFDGHISENCAIYVSGTDPKRGPSQKSLTEVLRDTQEWKDYLASANADGTGRNIELLKNALTEAFKAIDRQMMQYLKENPKRPYAFGGCTAVTVMITPEWIVCANAGDSRATMCYKGGLSMVLSEDHEPENEKESARIKAAGGYVEDNRVNGYIAVSRALGNFIFKSDKNLEQADQKMSCIPEFYQYRRSPNEEEMIILACDGLWDVFSNDQAIEVVRKIWAEGEKNTVLVAEELIDRALFAGSDDNISAIVVKMKAAEVSPEGGGVAERRRNRPKVK